MKVKAVRDGYYGHRRRKAGDVFEVEEEAYYVKDAKGQPLLDKAGKPRTCSWMEPVDGMAAAPQVEAQPVEVDEDEDDDAI